MTFNERPLSEGISMLGVDHVGWCTTLPLQTTNNKILTAVSTLRRGLGPRNSQIKRRTDRKGPTYRFKQQLLQL